MKNNRLFVKNTLTGYMHIEVIAKNNDVEYVARNKLYVVYVHRRGTQVSM
jgi:hypothetical protein